jgi:ferric-dicitrate binding protein FerR (iron transport regulator)
MNIGAQEAQVRSARPETAETASLQGGPPAQPEPEAGEPTLEEPTPDEPIPDPPRPSRRRFAWIGTLASLALFAASLFVLWHIAVRC